MTLIRRRRFSLLTLLLTVLLIGSAVTLWLHWEPWRRRFTLADGKRAVLFAAFSIDESKAVWVDETHFVHVADIETGAHLTEYKAPISGVHCFAVFDSRPIMVTDGARDLPLPDDVWKPAFDIRHPKAVPTNISNSPVREAIATLAAQWGEQIVLSQDAISSGKGDTRLTFGTTADTPLMMLEKIVAYAGLTLESYGAAIDVVTPEEAAAHKNAHADSAAHVFDLTTGYPITVLKAMGPVSMLTVSADGNRLLAADRNNMRTWKLDGGHPQFAMQFRQSTLSELSLSDDGKRLANISGAKIEVWELEQGAALLQRYCETSPSSLAISPDGQHTVYCFGDRSAEIWRVDDGSMLRRIAPEGTFWQDAMAPVYSPDGARVIFPANDSTHILDVRNGAEIGTCIAGRALAARFSTDDRVALVFSGHSEIRRADGAVLAALPQLPRIEQLISGYRSVFGGTTAATPAMKLDRCSSPRFSRDNQTLIANTGQSLGVWSHQRPEEWWGVLCLVEFWTTLALATLFALSALRDWKK